MSDLVVKIVVADDFIDALREMRVRIDDVARESAETRADRDRWVQRVKELEAQLQRVREVVR